MSLKRTVSSSRSPRKHLIGQLFLAVTTSFAYVCLLTGCNDVSKVPPPDPGPGALTITTAALDNATVNQPYAEVVGGTGGITPYTWSLATGSPALPPGLTLDPLSGAVTGIPTVVGTTDIIFRLEDESNPPQVVSKTIPLIVVTTPQPLSITTTSLLDGTINQPYPQTDLKAAGGIQPYVWSVNPALPNGLQLNLVSPGMISGTPLGPSGTTQHTFTVRDSAAPFNQTATRQLALRINPAPAPLAITAPSGSTLPSGRINRNYNTTLAASGGILPYTWSIAPALPAGLTLNASTGAITGRPTVTGVFTLTITLKDSFLPTNQTRTKVVTLTITL